MNIIAHIGYLSSMKNLRKTFITGVIVIVPISVTIWILVKFFTTLDSILSRPIRALIGFRIPGLGFILVLTFVFFTGLIASNVIGKKITAFIDDKILNIPIIKTIYQPLKDIMQNIANKESNNFKKAVMLEFPKENCFSIGFITKENIDVDGEFKTAIFVPTTPNPTSGFLLYLNKDKYTELDITIEAALKSIISVGSISPEVIKFARSKSENT